MRAGVRCLVPGVLACTALGVTVSQRPRAKIDVYFDEDGNPTFYNRTLPLAVSDSNLRTRASDEERCLNFLHIPKTGGTSVEKAMNHISHLGHTDFSLQCEGLGHHCPTQKGTPLWRCCTMKDGSQCSVWHVPPKADALLRKSYSSCETFCVVREPAARFRSQHMYAGGECSTAALKRAVDTKLAKARKTPYMDDCHLIPQVEFWNNGKDCQHVVQQENLEAALTHLLAKYDMVPHFPQKRALEHECQAKFDAESLEKLQKFYHKDYYHFGYSLKAKHP